MSAATLLKPKGIGVRHYQAMMTFSGLVLAFSLRVNLSVGIVAMTDMKSTSGIKVLEWDISQKGIILSSIFWGYVVLQIPFGHLARTVGPKYVLFCAMMFCSLATLLSPYIALNYSWTFFCLTRFVIGLGQGAVFPSIFAHIAKWAPPSEQNRIFAGVFVGTQVGATLTLFVAGYLAASSWGWPSIFYVTGISSLIWSVVWLFLGANSPDTHPSISDCERNYIKSELIHSSDKSSVMRTPWRKILTSRPVWAVHASSFGYLWSYWTFITFLPNYFSHVLGFDIKNNGLLASLPYLLKCFLTVVISWITDFTTSRNIIPLSVSRKIWTSMALWGGAAALLCLPMTDSVPGATILLTFTVAAGAGAFCGYLSNPLDLAPNFSSVIIGISNTIGNINAILGPLVTGFIVQDETSRDQWMIAFYICAATSFVGNLVFIFWGSTTVQPWNST